MTEKGISFKHDLNIPSYSRQFLRHVFLLRKLRRFSVDKCWPHFMTSLLMQQLNNDDFKKMKFIPSVKEVFRLNQIYKSRLECFVIFKIHTSRKDLFEPKIFYLWCILSNKHFFDYNILFVLMYSIWRYILFNILTVLNVHWTMKKFFFP